MEKSATGSHQGFFFLEMLFTFWGGGELLLWGEKNVKSVVPSNS